MFWSAPARKAGRYTCWNRLGRTHPAHRGWPSADHRRFPARRSDGHQKHAARTPAGHDRVPDRCLCADASITSACWSWSRKIMLPACGLCFSSPRTSGGCITGWRLSAKAVPTSGSQRLLLDLRGRLHQAGLANGAGFRMPMTQQEIADHLGLTLVHVNRVLRRLREAGIVTVQRGVVSVDEMARLSQLAAPLQDIYERATPEFGGGQEARP